MDHEPNRLHDMTTMRIEDMLAIDVEASGLHVGSYPIQFGFCSLDLDVRSFHLRRAPTWTDEDWTQEAERIHRTSREDLETKGLDLAEAARRWSDAVSGRHLVSDNPAMDEMWINRFLAEIGVEDPVVIWHFDSIVHSMVVRGMPEDVPKATMALFHARQTYPHTHDAGDDALRLAASLKAVWEAIRAADNVVPFRPRRS